jgi:hypothetical protein
MSFLEKTKNSLPKSYWVTYRLQSLSTEKFLEVVQKILDGEHVLFKSSEIHFENSETIKENS